MAHAAGAVYEALRAGILEGEYALGSRLGEVELAGSLGVSRTPVREALRRLDSEGLVDVLPNRGARVASWCEQDLDDIYELRALLESHGAARAATRVSAAQLTRLDELCADMDATVRRRDLERHSALNRDFHTLILIAAGNPRLMSLMSALVHVPLVLRTFHRYGRKALRRSQGHHRELVDALRARDASWAEAVMRSHVLAARAVLTAAPGPEPCLPAPKAHPPAPLPEREQTR